MLFSPGTGCSVCLFELPCSSSAGSSCSMVGSVWLLSLPRDILKSLKSLSLSGESWPDYDRQDWHADDEAIRSPPTTHLVATIDNLNDVLDFDSEDIDGMDDDVGDGHEPTPIGH